MAKNKRKYVPPKVYDEKLPPEHELAYVPLAPDGTLLGRGGNTITSVQSPYPDVSASDIMAKNADEIRASIFASDVANCPDSHNHNVHVTGGKVIYTHIAGDFVENACEYTLVQFKKLGWAEVATQLAEWIRELHG